MFVITILLWLNSFDLLTYLVIYCSHVVGCLNGLFVLNIRAIKTAQSLTHWFIVCNKSLCSFSLCSFIDYSVVIIQLN